MRSINFTGHPVSPNLPIYCYIVFIMKLKRQSRKFIDHSYTLWGAEVKDKEGTHIADALVISMGEHGSMYTCPAKTQIDIPKDAEAAQTLNDLVDHNIAEMQRALEESIKWRLRMDNTPLGKTPQDFDAYYTDVIATFKEWFTAHGIPVPD
jgi:hypothetical protein